MISLDAVKQIEEFKQFIDEHIKDQILEMFQKKKESVVIDFLQLSKEYPVLADDLMDNPTEVFQSFKIAAQTFNDSNHENYNLRFKNLPGKGKRVGDLRTKDLGRFLKVSCQVNSLGILRSRAASAKYECPSCGSIIHMLQLGKEWREPKRCGCGRRGQFNLLSKDLYDIRPITFEEQPENIGEGFQACKIAGLLKHDLVGGENDLNISPGNTVVVSGVLEEVPVNLAQVKGKSTEFDWVIDVNLVESQTKSKDDITLSKKDIKEIKEFAKQEGFYGKIVRSFSPSTFGMEKEREACVLAMVCGVETIDSSGKTVRGNIHVLMVGEPGKNKSGLLKRGAELAWKSRYSSGQGLSAAGLTAAIIRDPLLGQWSAEPGVLVLCNGGTAWIDELDKMNQDDRGSIHEGMEMQTVTKDKANVHITMNCKTGVVAACNPKNSMFDDFEENFLKQVNLDPALVDRFDLIFKLRNLPDVEQDRKLAEIIFDHAKGKIVQEISDDFLRKYLWYAHKLKPSWTLEAEKLVKDWYPDVRQRAPKNAIPTTARELQGLMRLSSATAKLHLSETIQEEHVRNALALLNYSLGQIGCINESGAISTDLLYVEKNNEQAAIRNELLAALEYRRQNGETIIREEEIISHIVQKLKVRDDKVIEVIEWLKRTADLFEPKSGWVALI